MLILILHTHRPEGIYSVTHSKKKKNLTDPSRSNEQGRPLAASSSRLAYSSASPSIMTSASDIRYTPATSNLLSGKPHGKRYATSVINTTAMPHVQTDGNTSDSWEEEFDHLENLVSTLNDTVTSMSHESTKNGGYSSITIVSNGRVRGIRQQEEVAEIAVTPSSLSQDLGDRELGPVIREPISSSTRRSGKDDGGHYLENQQSSSSDASLVKENMAAITHVSPSHAASETAAMGLMEMHSITNSYASNSTSEVVLGGHELENERLNVVALETAEAMMSSSEKRHLESTVMSELGRSPVHSSTPLEPAEAVVSGELEGDGSGAEFDENLVELLKFGNSADLHMV